MPVRVLSAVYPLARSRRPSSNSYEQWFRQPEIVAETWKAARANAEDITKADARTALQQLDPLWDELFPAEQSRIVALLIERVDIGTDGLNVLLRMDGLTGLSQEMMADLGAAP